MEHSSSSSESLEKEVGQNGSGERAAAKTSGCGTNPLSPSNLQSPPEREVKYRTSPISTSHC